MKLQVFNSDLDSGRDDIKCRLVSHDDPVIAIQQPGKRKEEKKETI